MSHRHGILAPMKTQFVRVDRAISVSIAIALGTLGSVGHAADAAIDPARLSAHVKVLSSDAFEGRAPASAEEPDEIQAGN